MDSIIAKENDYLRKENHALAFELWRLSIGEGIESPQSAYLQNIVLTRENIELGGGDIDGLFDTMPELRGYWQLRAGKLELVSSEKGTDND